MVASAERIPQLYLFALEILLAFGNQVTIEVEKKKEVFYRKNGDQSGGAKSCKK
jgi:N utilization substance protein B